VYVPAPLPGLSDQEELRYRLAISDWNLMWEAGTLRGQVESFL